MATIKSAIVVQDMASSIISRINSNLDRTNNGFASLNSKMQSAPTQALNNALRTELAYQSELQVLKQVESEARKIIAAEGTQSARAQEIIESVRLQRELVSELKNDYDKITNSINNNVEASNRHSNAVRDVKNNMDNVNNSIINSNNSGNNLLSTIRNIAIAVGGIGLIKNMLNMSDEMINTEARLSFIVDDKNTVETLENKIFAMSMNAGAAYQTTADVITKLGMQAGKAFNSNDELLAFADQLNKTFSISGTSVTGIESTMYNLTQALSSGVLRGQDLNAVFSNAPQLVQNIADYMDVDIGKIRELASEGKISASIVKNAVLAAAEETNAKYNQMPTTWSQIWTRIKNIVTMALRPVLQKINELANNPQVQIMFNKFIDGASLAAQAILGLIEGIAWLTSVLEPLEPLIIGIVAAYVAFNIISGITSAVLGIVAFAHEVKAAAAATDAIATAGATGAQWGLNAALFACPITWIVIAIIALIAVLTYLWFTNNKVACAMIFLWDALKLGIMAAGLGIQAIWYGLLIVLMYLWLGVQNCVLGMMTAWYGFQTGIEAVCVGVLYIFQGLYNGVIWIVNGIIKALNMIPGVSIDTVEYADFADKAMNNMMDRVVDRNQKLQDMASGMQDTVNQIDSMKSEFASNLTAGANAIQSTAIEMNATRQDRTDHRNDWIQGAGSAIKGALDNFSLDPSAYAGDGTLGDIAGNTKSIADNTAEITDEDLKYLIDIADRETVNRFTTVPLTINMTNNNEINSDEDIDGIVDKLTTRLEEELLVISEGVHE